MIPAGEYVARATPASEWGESSRGKEECRIKFRIEEGEHKGETITAFQYASTEANAAITIKSLRICGCTFPGDDITDLSGIDANQVRIVVVEDEWEGTVRMKVKYINPLDGVDFGKPMEGGKRTSFAQRMKGAVIMAKSKESEAPAPEVKGDIPF